MPETGLYHVSVVGFVNPTRNSTQKVPLRFDAVLYRSHMSVTANKNLVSIIMKTIEKQELLPKVMGEQNKGQFWYWTCDGVESSFHEICSWNVAGQEGKVSIRWLYDSGLCPAHLWQGELENSLWMLLQITDGRKPSNVCHLAIFKQAFTMLSVSEYVPQSKLNALVVSHFVFSVCLLKQIKTKKKPLQSYHLK